ncbi:MAG: hypothetical protein K6F44_01255 [Lachnospiraceae bacterium]|nr:hypothetical protein [Lachnospiraceae bacterium]
MEKPLTKDEILKILDQYRIGRKPLAKLLGWGETTVMQYLNCDNIPDNEYTKKLKKLLDDPGYYRDVLVNGKNNITAVAYKKSIAAVDSMFKGSPILECANWACACINEKLAETGRRDSKETRAVSLLRLESVLLWSQIFAIRLLGKPLFEDDFQPGKTGLPYKEVEVDYSRLVTMNEISGTSLSAEAKKLMAKVNEVLMWYGPTALFGLMKAEIYRLCGAPGARRRRIVRAETLRKAYSEVFDQAGVRKLKDIESYLQKRMAFIKKYPPQ